MVHVDPAHLVELALGNAAIGDDDAGALQHIARCVRCREELTLMTRLVGAARNAEPADMPTAPPEHVWERIHDQLVPQAETSSHSRGEDVRQDHAAPIARVRLLQAAHASRRRRHLVLTLLAGMVVVWWSRHGRSRPTSERRRAVTG
ncbi:hypothetical protein GCM10010377_48570 [Streptomyces viridiviolaceus]|uniref:Zinc-finger domain-containing protein n=1 Tax=Streptomyces viridiviolaceus TaxID=68282 RepID=A0ABW2E877_9ACTN|nr:hypothetical protein [Streptomyces viridiviolaceus]GHB51803.1 hypothetical protein GCM10010377_48570 [Streptomyces viridiviolaceus]